MADYELKIINQTEQVNQLSAISVSFFVAMEPILITEKDILVKRPACFDKNRAKFSNDRNKKPVFGNLKDITDDIV